MENTQEETRTRVRQAIERARKASRHLTTAPGDEEFRKMLEARGIDYQDFMKYQRHVELNSRWMSQMKERYGDRNQELNNFDPGKLNCRAELTPVGVCAWDTDIPVYKEDLEMISKAAPLADRILHKMHERHMDEVKRHNQEVRCTCGLEELPMGPDTTENIHEVVDDPEMADVQAGWYARKNQSMLDEWDRQESERELERQEMNKLFHELKQENRENMETNQKFRENMKENIAALEKYTVKNAGDWEERRKEHEDVLSDRQPQVRHTIGYLEPQPQGTVVNPCLECPVDTCPSNPESKFITSIDDTPGETKMLQEDYAFNYDSLLRKMQDTHARKNSDYGDAAYKGYKKYGDYYFLVQLNNKLSRLESLTIGNKKQQVLDESIDDTLMDMANYAIMYLESRHRHD